MGTSPRLRLHFAPTGSLLDSARDAEAEIFLREYGNTATTMAEEYGAYEDASVFLALTDETGQVVAETRLITPSAAGLKTLNDVGRAPWHMDGPRAARAAGLDLDRTWDVATIGIRPGFRSSALQAAVAMYHGIYRGMRANGIRWIVMLTDERARRLLESALCATHALPGAGSGEYLGSPDCTPIWADARTGVELQRARNPEAYRLIVQGAGLDRIELPADDRFVLRPRVLA